MGARLRSWWQKIRQHPFIVAGIIVVIFAITAFAIGVIKFGWGWTGFTGGESKVTTTIFTPGTTTATPGTTVATEQLSAKTLWDWLGLLAVLAIPIVVGFGAAWFTAQQVKVSDRENKDNQLEAALQSYIDQMSEYLMEKKLPDSNPEDEVRKLARVRTLTTLQRLDARRKGLMLNFLNEAGLIDKDKCLIDLSGGISTNVYGADLEGAYLPGRNLRGTNLSAVFLSKANLERANLTEANLTEANLSGAKLSGAKLSGADLSTTVALLT
jgi:hypothetical protein